MPLVSVIVPNFNHARFLDQRLQCVLEQTLQDFEIILLDDASSDDSRQVIARYDGHPRIRIVRNEHNSGSACHQWNQGVALATAPYVWIAESDDLAEPELLATLVARLEASPETVLAYAQSWQIDENNQRTADMLEWTSDIDPHRWRADFTNDGRAECAAFLAMKNTIPNASAVVFRRDAFLTAGGACESLRLCGDWMTWARLLQHGRVAFVAQRLNAFRVHDGTVRATTSRIQMVEESLAVSGFISSHSEPSTSDRKRAARAMLQLWWATLKNGALPSIAATIRVATASRHLGWFVTACMLALPPMAWVRRSAIGQLLWRLKR